MTIQYYDANYPQKKQIVYENLASKKIVSWEIYPESRLGYKGGNLAISFDTSHLQKVTNEGGIYPPIPQILNYEEVLEYLERNFKHLQTK